MSDLNAQFEAAAQAAQSLAKRPDNQTMLTLYGLYKQATAGDVAAARPGGFDFVAQAKYDAWSKLKGTTQAAAMQQYIDLVAKLRAS
jgi:acyl-CoA-binding protein